jgi:hypothetical protein
MMKALVKTKSNYRNLNGTWVDIIQFLGTVVYCETIDESNTKVRFDLNIKEIESIVQALD